MKTRAAVAFAPKQPLEIVEVDLDGPKAGEVLVEIKATGICHTDAYTLDGFDSEGIFPSMPRYSGAAQLAYNHDVLITNQRTTEPFAFVPINRVVLVLCVCSLFSLT